MKIRCTTTFDITATGITGHYKSSRIPFVDRAGNKIINESTWNRSRNQQRNWETLTQLLSLRTQVNISSPYRDSENWAFDFDFEIDGIFDNGADDLGTLKSDCVGVPMLVGLGETVYPGLTLNPNVNIWFTQIE